MLLIAKRSHAIGTTYKSPKSYAESNAWHNRDSILLDNKDIYTIKDGIKNFNNTVAKYQRSGNSQMECLAPPDTSPAIITNANI